MWKETVLDIDITQDPSQEVIEIPNEDTTPSDDKSKAEVEDTTPSETQKPKQKNKSNFKNLAKAKRILEKENAELKAKLAWEDAEDDDEEEDDSDEPLYDRVDLLEFITDTPWAWELKNQIKETLDEFPWISFEKAFAFAKAQIPEESASHTMFNTKSVQTPKSKKLNDLTVEEAANANLTPEQYDTWSTSQKKNVNPFGG